MPPFAIWTQHSSGTMTSARLYERAGYVARADLYGNGIIIYWTDDGTDAGNSLFNATVMPWVEVVAADIGNPQAWTPSGNHGPMLRQDYLTNMSPFCWQNQFDSGNSIWYTTVAQGVPQADGGSGGTKYLDGYRAGGQGTIAKRPIVAHAYGLAPS